MYILEIFRTSLIIETLRETLRDYEESFQLVAEVR